MPSRDYLRILKVTARLRPVSWSCHALIQGHGQVINTVQDPGHVVAIGDRQTLRP